MMMKSHWPILGLSEIYRRYRKARNNIFSYLRRQKIALYNFVKRFFTSHKVYIIDSNEVEKLLEEGSFICERCGSAVSDSENVSRIEVDNELIFCHKQCNRS
jgi:hypothetical protein